MPTFTYIARSRTGERLEGAVEAADRRAALSEVERLGHVPVSVKEGLAPRGRAKRKTKGKGEGGEKRKGLVMPWAGHTARMSLRDLLVFTRELSDLLTSGMTLGQALHTLSRRSTDRAQDKVIGELRDEIIQGASLSEGLARRPESFTPLYVSMVKAGEASGTLPEVLERLDRHFERVIEAREKVLMALIYPGIVLSVGFATMIFAMVFVVPRFNAIFAELNSTLPLPTRILIGSSDILIKYGWAIALAGVFGFIAARNWVRTESGKRWWHGKILRMPVVKHIVTANAFSHFARTLGALLANGVPVLQALSIVENTVGNVCIASEIRDARERVTDGSSISGPLAAGDVFPPLLTDMLAVGEQSGDMSGALMHISRRYDDELDRAVKVLTTVLEPILIVVMAVLVGFVAISMLLAVFDLTSGLSV